MDATATSDASAATYGGSVAVVTVNEETIASIEGSGTIDAYTVDIIALSIISGVTSSTASMGGASSNETTTSELTSGYADTSSGSLTVGAAIAVSVLNGETLAHVSSAGGDLIVTSTGAQRILASSQRTSRADADGRPADSSSEENSVGVAIAVNVASTSTRSFVTGPVTLDTPSLSIEATMPASGTSGATAMSGLTDSRAPPSVAGALAVNVSGGELSASVFGDVIVTGAVSLLASGESSSSASALGSTEGTASGVGASFALNISANDVAAQIADGATLSGAADLSLNAQFDATANTEATAGSALGAGEIGVAGAVATTVSSNDVAARIGSGSALGVKGDFDATANLSGRSSARADGKTGGTSVAVGAAVAINIATDDAVATTARNIDASGTVTFQAFLASAGSADAIASAAGASGETTDTSGTFGVDGLINAERSHAASTAAESTGTAGASEDASGTGIPKAETSDGPVSVAAAIAVNVTTGHARAHIPDGRVISAGDTLTLRSSNNADGSALADGSATNTDGGTGTIGAAVAINVTDMVNEASIGDATVTAGGLVLEALMTDVDGDVSHTASAEASAGAGSGQFGVAGAVAVNVSPVTTRAGADTRATVVIDTVIAGDGDVSFSAESTSSATATATGAQEGASDAGIGAGVAVNVVSNRVTAELGDDATLSGANDFALNAASDATAEAYAAAGGESGTGLGLGGAVATTIASNTVRAQLGSGAKLVISGDLDATAAHKGSSKSKAVGDATSGEVAVGVVIALNITTDDVSATTGRDVDASGTVAFQALCASAGSAEAYASAAGAAAETSETSGTPGVDERIGKEQSLAASMSAETSASADTSGTSIPKAESSDGPVSVAAAIAVNVTTSHARATIPSGRVIKAGDTLTLRASNNADGSALADGSATNDAEGKATIGAAVAINVCSVLNEASIATSTVTAGGLVLEALMTDVDGDTTHASSAEASAGAGFGKTGVAGALAVNVAPIVTTASQGSGSTVAITGGGNVSFDAESSTSAESAATASQEGGGDVGVGAGIAVNVVLNDVTAELANGAVLNGARDFALNAESDATARTYASAGGEAKSGPGIGGAVATTIVDNYVRARVGTGSTLKLTRDFSANAASSGAYRTKADGEAAGSDAAIGIVIAVSIVNDTALATTDRALEATGAVAFGAACASSAQAIALASAVGTSGESTETSGTAGVDDKIAKEIGQAGQQGAAGGAGGAGGGGGGGGGSSTPPPAGSSDGPVSVAAAIAVSVIDSTARAMIPANGRVVSGGVVSLDARNNTDTRSHADASATTTATAPASVGAAVALNLANVTNEAVIGHRATVNAQGVRLTAMMADVSGDRTHAASAETTSGAGGGKVGFAGSLPVNIVFNHTRAVIESGAVVACTTGDVILTAESYQSDEASATSNAMGKTGIGAAVATNVLLSDTRAEIEDDAVITGGGDYAINAVSGHWVWTATEAGATGGTAISPSVAVAVVIDKTTARLGRSATGLSATGNVTVASKHSAQIDTVADGNAKSAGIAVGAAVGVNVILPETSAEIARDVQGASVSVISTSTVSSSVICMASASGNATESAEGTPTRDADSEAGAQVNNNPNVNNNVSSDKTDLPKSKDETGDSSGSSGASKTSRDKTGQKSAGVGVAAAISVNVVTVTNRASIADGLTVSGSGGPVNVAAIAQTDAFAKATGSSVSTSSGQARIGAAVGLNVVSATNIASTGTGTSITGNGIAIEAIIPDGETDDVVVWGMSASGGKDQANIAGSVAVNVVSRTNRASVGASSALRSTGALTVRATSADRLQALAAGGALSMSGVGVGAAVAVQVATLTTEATVDSGVQLDASEALSVTAESSLQPVAAPIPSFVASLTGTPYFTTLAVAGGFSQGNAGVGGSVLVDVFLITTRAAIGDSAQINQTVTPGIAQHVKVAAKDTTAIKDYAGGIGGATGTAGVGVSVDVVVLTQDVEASIGSNAAISAAGSMEVTATSTIDLDLLSVCAGVSGGTAGVGGSIVVIVPSTSTLASVGDNAVASVGGDFAVTATHRGDLMIISGAAGGASTAGVGGSIVTVVRSDETKASVGKGSTIVAGGDVRVAAVAHDTVNVWGVAAAGGGTAGVAGAIVTLTITSTVDALVDDNTSLTAGGDLTVSADSTSGLVTAAGAAGVGGTAGVGLCVVTVVKTDTTTSRTGSNTLLWSNGGLTTLAATSTDDSDLVAIGIAAAGTVDFKASVITFVENETTKALLGAGSTIRGPNGVVISAKHGCTDDHEVTMVAGAVGGAGTASIGLSDINYVRDDETSAIVGAGSAVISGGNVTISADSIDELSAVAVTGGGAGAAAVSGSVVVVVSDGWTEASLGSGSSITASGTVSISATSDTDMLGIAGSVAGGGAAGVGGGSVAIDAEHVTKALAGDSVAITTGGAFSITATSTVDISAYTACASGGGAAGVSGAVNVLLLGETVEATFGASGTIAAAGGVTVRASRVTDVTSFAGAAAGGGAAGVGVSSSTIVETDSVKAGIGAGTHVTAGGDVTVSANSSETIYNLGVAGAGGGAAGVAGSVTVVILDETTWAWLGDGVHVHALKTGLTPKVSVTASDTTDTMTLAGAASGGGAAGVAESVDVLTVKKRTQAWVGGVNSVIEAGGDVVVAATSVEDVNSISLTGTGAGVAGVPGGAAVLTFDLTTRAFINGPGTVTAGGSILVSASDIEDVDVITGNLSGAGAVTVGTAASVIIVTKTTEAYVGPTVTMTAAAAGAGLSVANGTFGTAPAETGTGQVSVAQPDFTGTQLATNVALGDMYGARQVAVPGQTAGFRGIAVVATNCDDIASYAISGSASGVVAVNVGGSVHIANITTRAYVAQGSTLGSSGSLLVSAGTSYTHIGVAAVLSGSGAAAVSPGAVIIIPTLVTEAYLADGVRATVSGDVVVVARASEDILAVAVGAAGSGGVGVGGAVPVVILASSTSAHIGATAASAAAGAGVIAQGNVLVLATDDTDIEVIAGGAGLGIGAAGIGASVDVTKVTKQTKAYLGTYASVDARATTASGLTDVYTGVMSGATFQTYGSIGQTFKGVAVQAGSSEDILAIVVAGGGGFGAGIAGAVGVNVISSNTQAYIGDNALVNTTAGAEGVLQSVSVVAANKAKVLTVYGSLGGGIVGIGGSVDVGMLRNDVAAYVGNGAHVQATHNVNVVALSNADVDAYVFSIGGGIVGAAGSVSVWTIGGTSNQTYTVDNNGGAANQSASALPASVVNMADHQSDGSDPNGGFRRIVSGYGGTGDADTRVANATAAAGTSITAAAPSTVTGTALGWTPPATIVPRGTVAFIGSYATVRADDDITVRADSAVNYYGLIGQASGGIAGIGASIAVVGNHLNTEAFIGSHATVAAGTAATDDLTVAANGTSTLDVDVFAGQGGGVTLGAQVGVLTDASSQRAHIDSYATIERAGGVVTIAATADRDVISSQVSVSLAGVAAGASVSLAEITGTTSASTGDVQIGSLARVGSLVIAATSDATVDADAWAVQGGVATVSGCVATAYVHPTVSASLGTGADARAIGTVTVTSSSLTSVDAKAFGVNVGAAVAFGASVAKATSSPTVSATVGGGATVDSAGLTVRALNNYRHNVGTGADDLASDKVTRAEATAGGGGLGLTVSAAWSKALDQAIVSATVGASAVIDAGSGDVAVVARSGNQVRSSATGVAVGSAGYGGPITRAESSGSVSAYLNGSVRDIANASLSGGRNVLVQAQSHDDAASLTTAAQVTLAGVAYSQSVSVASPTVRARVDGGVVRVTGTVTVQVLSRGTALAECENISSGAVAAGTSFADASVSPTLEASVISGASIEASGAVKISILHNCDSAGNALAGTTAKAVAWAPTFGVAGGQGAVPTANANASLDARVDSGCTLGSSSTLTIEAYASNHAIADAQALSIGAGAVGASQPTATANGTARARMNGTVSHGTNFTIQAKVYATAKADADASGGGLLAAQVPHAVATASPTVEASIGNGGRASVSGAVTIRATSQCNAASAAKSFSIAGGAVGTMKATSTVSPTVSATIGTGADIEAGSLTIEAGHNYGLTLGARADCNSTSGSLVGYDGAVPMATSAPVVSARVGTGTVITLTGAFSLTSRATINSISTANSLSISAAAVGASTSSATANGTIQATMDGTIDAGTNVTVIARAVAYADAYSEASGGGLISGKFHSATAVANPSVLGRAGNGSTAAGIDVTGAVSIRAESEADAAANCIGGLNLGLAAVGLNTASATSSPVTDAQVGANSVVRGGSIDIVALYNRTDAAGSVSGSRRWGTGWNNGQKGARAQANATSGGLFTGDGATASATSNAVTRTTVGTGVRLQGRSGSIQARAFSNSAAYAKADGDAYGLAGGGSVRGTAAANGTTTVSMLSLASLDTSSSLSARAVATNLADADTSAGSLTFVSGRESRASATAAPTVQANVSTTGVMNVATDVTILALANGNSSSDAVGNQYGLASLGISAATANWNPTVTAGIASGTVNAGGNIYVRAYENHNESGGVIAANQAYAYASSVGAGVGSASAADATANSTAIVTSYVGAGTRLISTGVASTVDIVALSRGAVYSSATGRAYGVAAGGSINSAATRRNNTNAYVADSAAGAGALLRGYNVRIYASSNDAGYSYATAGNGGLITAGGAAATASTPDLYVKARLGNYGVIEAVNRGDVLARRSLYLDSASHSYVVGGINYSQVNATSRADRAYTIAQVGTGATVTAYAIEISAVDTSIYAHAHAHGEVPFNMLGWNHATSVALLDLHPQVRIYGGGSALTATGDLGIYARADSVTVNSDAYSYTSGLTGSVIAEAWADRWVTASTQCDSGSSLTGRNVSIRSIVPLPADGGYIRKAEAVGATVVNYVYEIVGHVARQVCRWVATVGCGFGLWCDPDEVCDTVFDPVWDWVAHILNTAVESRPRGAQSLVGNITVNSNIHVTGGGRAEAAIDATGRVTRSDGVVIRDGFGTIVNVGQVVSTGTIYIDDILGGAGGKLLVDAPSGATSGFSNVHFDATMDAVVITNLSNKHLVVNDIETFNVADPPTITHNAMYGYRNWTYSLTSNSHICDVAITNNSNADTDITLNGYIQNSLGTTSVHNLGAGGGDIIQTAGPTIWINSRVVSLISDSGMVGTAGRRIQVGLAGEASAPDPGGG
ncbi:MAG: hypothetical protein U1E26_09780 [Coriobacteriia bacterium]|nr:hypothetical protein [Coriobacteriia bacterium]